jgi:septum formation inhibitor-activating ATPase MinD
VGLGIDEVEKTLKTNIEVLVPSSRDVPLCVNRGEPVATGAPKSGVTMAFTRLAEAIGGLDGQEDARKNGTSRSRFARIRR